MIRIEYVSERIENLTALREKGYLVPIRRYKGKTRTLLSSSVLDRELHTLATVSLQKYKLMYLEHMFKSNSDKLLEVLDSRPYLPSYFKDTVREIVSKLIENDFECFTTEREGDNFSFVWEIKNVNNPIPSKVRSVFEIHINLPNQENELETNDFTDSTLGSEFIKLMEAVTSNGGYVGSKRVGMVSNVISYHTFNDKHLSPYLECTVKIHSDDDKPKGKEISNFDVINLMELTVIPSMNIKVFLKTFSTLFEKGYKFYITESENGFCITVIDSGKIQIVFYFKTLIDFNYVY